MVAGLPAYANINNAFSAIDNDFILWVKDLHNNFIPASGDLVMTQQSASVPYMIDFAGLILTSNMPTRNEYFGLNLGILSNVNQSSTPILQDFLPTQLDISDFNQNMVYNAIVPYRQVSIQSDVSFNNITINALKVDSSGVPTPINLAPKGFSSIKLMFTKKVGNKYA